MSRATFATIHEYRPLSPSLAVVTASVSSSHPTPEVLRAALASALGAGVTPVRGSFRWIDSETRDSVIGFVHASTPVQVLEGAAPDEAKFHRVQANVYMSKDDETLWEVKEGAGSKYLARKGQVDLTSTLEQARVSPKGSMPRMRSVASAQAEVHEIAAFVVEGTRTAEVDVGAVVSRFDDGALLVRSATQNTELRVDPAYLVQAFTLTSAPSLPREVVAREVASRKGPKAVTASAAALTPQEYWKLAYGHAPEYLNLILRQVEEQGVA